MPRKQTTTKKAALQKEIITSSPIEELSLNNPIPLFTISFTRNEWATQRIPTLHAPTNAGTTLTCSSVTKVVSKRATPSLFASAPLPKKPKTFIAIEDELASYGDLSSASLAKQTVIQSLGEAIANGVFESPNNTSETETLNSPSTATSGPK